jgi:hypothetical protein
MTGEGCTNNIFLGAVGCGEPWVPVFPRGEMRARKHDGPFPWALFDLANPLDVPPWRHFLPIFFNSHFRSKYAPVTASWSA